MVKKILHIGIITKDFKKGIDRFKNFGLPLTEIKELKDIGIKIGFFSLGDASLELIGFIDPEKSKNSIVQKYNTTINHICFEVDDLEKTIQEFEKNGAKIVPGYPKAGAHGQVAFFYPETTEDVLIELCQILPHQSN
jgi:methylmalonyl-CoA/ethylmalonyl-CoA epimerase